MRPPLQGESGSKEWKRGLLVVARPMTFHLLLPFPSFPWEDALISGTVPTLPPEWGLSLSSEQWQGLTLSQGTLTVKVPRILQALEVIGKGTGKYAEQVGD